MRMLLPDRADDRALDDARLAELYAYPERDPWVRANFVSTLDGAAQGPDHRSGSISGSGDRRVLALLRALADVIVVGAGTARAERYGPATIRPEHAGIRAALGLPPTPPIAVVTQSMSVPDQLLADPRTIIITGSAASEAARGWLADRVDVAVCGTDRAAPDGVIDALRARGHRRILTEGGPTFFAELAAADLVDELCLTMTPVVLGGDAMRVTHGRMLDSPASFDLTQLLEDEGFLFGRWLRSGRPG